MPSTAMCALCFKPFSKLKAKLQLECRESFFTFLWKCKMEQIHTIRNGIKLPTFLKTCKSGAVVQAASLAPLV